MTEIQMKRVYEEAEEQDGFRILVDRLWPRGVKKEDLPHDLWATEIAPSTEIRKEFDHQEEKFEQFKKDYTFELNENPKADTFIETVSKALETQNVTLLYAAKDTQNNHAVVLKEWLEKTIV